MFLGEDRLPQINRLGEAAAERIAGWLDELGVSAPASSAK